MIGLPVLITIPHGGNRIPPEVKPWFALDDRNVFDDSDPFVREIFRFPGTITFEAEIARAVVDVNRVRKEGGKPERDGHLKTHTRQGVPVYRDGWFPDPAMASRLVKRYYEPYHRKILKTLTSQDIQFAFDCHTMTENEGDDRPMICISNEHGRTCSQEHTEILAECFRSSFGLAENEVRVNDPFTGGHLIRTFGNRPAPWVQVDINRKMFLTEPWYDHQAMTVDMERIAWLNKGFTHGVASFFSKAGFKARVLTMQED